MLGSEHMFKLKSLAIVAIGGMSVVNLISADKAHGLTLNLYGTEGSNVIRYSATGSITVSQNYSELRRSTTLPFFAPQLIGGGRYRWDDNHHPGIVDYTNLPDADSILNNNLSLSEEISYQVNGNEFATLDRITFNESTATSGAPLYPTIDPIVTYVTYPALNPGDQVSWTGSGTVTLGQGTFETVFEAGRRGVPLSFSNPLDNSLLSGFDPETEPAFTVNVYPTGVVPEPLTILGAGTAIAFGASFKSKLAKARKK